MPTLNTTWLKRKINNVLTKTFAISHVKSTYYDYSEGTTLDDVLIETEDFDQSAVTEPDISPAILSKINEVSEQESSNFTLLSANKAEQTEVDSLKSDVVTNYATKSDVSTTYATKSDVSTTYLTKTEGEEIKKSVSDGKSEVASSITTMGVATAADATFHTMATNILAIESGMGELPLPIEDLACEINACTGSFTWTLPDDANRSGVEIWYNTEDDFKDTPSGTKAYDSDTTFGTDITSCETDFPDAGTTYYVAIYSYTYINNIRYYTKGSVISVETITPKGFSKITTSGTFTIPGGVKTVDICCVSGGYNGTSGTHGGSSNSTAGKGGSGGRVYNAYSVSVTPLQEYQVTVGASNGGDTLFGDLVSSASGTTPGNGGASGDSRKNSTYNGTGGPGGNGKYAFGDSSLDGILYGAGGGGGGTAYYSSKSYGGAGGTNGGGAGGNGCSTSTGEKPGSSATANTGSGGGGGGGGSSYGSDAVYGGSGASGICIVRWGY